MVSQKKVLRKLNFESIGYMYLEGRNWLQKKFMPYLILQCSIRKWTYFWKMFLRIVSSFCIISLKIEWLSIASSISFNAEKNCSRIYFHKTFLQRFFSFIKVEKLCTYNIAGELKDREFYYLKDRNFCCCFIKTHVSKENFILQKNFFFLQIVSLYIFFKNHKSLRQK